MIEVQDIIDDFDLLAYFDDRDITYHTTGKNTSDGWISIQCPFCEDGSNHLGINTDSLNYSCFKCAESGWIFKLIQNIENCRFPHARFIAESFTKNTNTKELMKEENYASHISLPPETRTKGVFPKNFVKFLTDKNFDESIIKKYDLKATHPVGVFANRIIIPYKMNRQIMTYSGRTIVNSDPPYLHLPKNQSLLHVKDMLYNIDTVKDNIIIVEGCSDVWCIGDGCVSTSGVQFTERQVNKLVKMDIKNCFIMFDSDATDMGEKLAQKLSIHIPHVENLKISEGDPGEFSINDVKNLRKDLKL